VKRLILVVSLAGAILSIGLFAQNGDQASSAKHVRVAVIDGMTMTPLWSELQKRFEADTCIKIQVVATGEKPTLARAIKEAKVDFLTMHSSDQTTNLVADGYARDIRPWAKNDLVIIGPIEDPAGVAGMNNGTEAIRKIAASRSNWLDSQSNGPREIAHSLFSSAGVNMMGPWVLKYGNTDSRGILHYVAGKSA
jgi:tungstate transport system substrate-binding protein